MGEQDVERSKKAAAEKAAEYIRDGMVVGLGTGSTAEYFIKKLAEKRLDIVVIPTSKRSEALAERLGMKLASIDGYDELDVDVDGADEIGPEFNLIKGGGGAHTSEKRVAEKAKKFIVIADYSKMVEKLGCFPVAVEVEPSKKDSVTKKLVSLGGKPLLREGFVTDRGNIIIDTKFKIENPRGLENLLNLIPGVIENGIFSRRRPEIVILGRRDKVEVLKRKNGLN